MFQCEMVVRLSLISRKHLKSKIFQSELIIGMLCGAMGCLLEFEIACFCLKPIVVVVMLRR